jgi:lipopolysaccharide/colanic/teichoic acid biosynthesis glycosyltransferase
MARIDLKHFLPEQARREWSVVSQVGLRRAAYLIVKRTMDIIISLLALILLSPFLAIVALLIKLDSPGPALFKQTRIGKDGVPFTFYKFRGMFVDARERFSELYDYTYAPEELETLYFHRPDDPRVTRIGRIIRKTAIDELPNFVNVLKGDMSLVGPITATQPEAASSPTKKGPTAPRAAGPSTTLRTGPSLRPLPAMTRKARLDRLYQRAAFCVKQQSGFLFGHLAV